MLLCSLRPLLLTLALAATAVPAVAQDWAKARLDKTPRHLEWVTVKHGNRDVKCFIGYPEVKTKATAVVLIHEIFGLTDWVRGMVDQFAEAGYIAIAPDFLSGAGPNGGGTDSFGANDNVRGKIQGLDPAQITADLDATVAYVGKLPAANGKVVVGGFCWGGAQTFRYATHNPNIAAGLVFYGSATEPATFAKIKAPLFGFYGGNDARITAAVPKLVDDMKAAGKPFDQVTYTDAGHGFMRSGEQPDATEPNKKARAESWVRIKAILGKL